MEYVTRVSIEIHSQSEIMERNLVREVEKGRRKRNLESEQGSPVTHFLKRDQTVFPHHLQKCVDPVNTR